MTESSFMMVILLLWSVPVLIYAILFLPELNQLVLGRVRPSRNDENDSAGIEMPFEYLLPIVAAAAVALIFSLLASGRKLASVSHANGRGGRASGRGGIYISPNAQPRTPSEGSRPRPSRAVSGGVEVEDPAANACEAGSLANASHVRIMRITLKAQERIKGNLRRICPVPRPSLMS